MSRIKTNLEAVVQRTQIQPLELVLVLVQASVQAPVQALGQERLIKCSQQVPFDSFLY